MPTYTGTPGNDTISGTTQADSISGGAGNDRINAALGADTILGEDGNDTINGGGGSDWISGGDGDDSLDGGYINPSLPENDTIDGGAGNDSVQGNVGNDFITGGEGDDSLDGGANDDTVLGGAGNDRVRGGEGSDSVDGGEGNDTVFGGNADDTVEGGAGDDLLYGDSPMFDSPLVGNDKIEGGAGNDTIYSGAGSDTVGGGDGDDHLYGEAGIDRLDGGEGDDFIDGGINDGAGDLLSGAEGFDTFTAGSGDTILDFNTATGQDFRDGDQSNNDFVDLSGHYNAANLAIINAARADAGLEPYANPLAWLRADQNDDGRLNDITTDNGFDTEFTYRIKNNDLPVDGKDLTWDNTNVVCFASDVLIQTASGRVPAGELSVGDLVLTRDAGLQPIRWIGSQHLDAGRLSQSPNLRPIRIRKDALGAGLPDADLVVSPQHRVLIRSRIAQRMFGASEVLVAAKQLCLLDGIDVAEDMADVTYVHFLFDDHQIVFSNGTQTESLYPGDQALKSVGDAARDEIFAIFPELRQAAAIPSARVLTSGRMGRKLAVRHRDNGKPLVSQA